VRRLLGLFFADGCLTCRRGPSSNYVKASLNAGVHERDFLEEKVAEIRAFIPTEAQIVPYQTPERASGNRTTVLRFRVSSTQLRVIYNLLYPCRQRRITRAAIELLDARAAAWFWAENARPGQGGWILRRVGSTAAEARLVADWLKDLCAIQAPTLLEDHVIPRLWLDCDQAGPLSALLRPEAPASRLHLFSGLRG
jgi:hypothetical protein